MADTETEVSAHYTTGALYDRVIEGLRAMGVDPVRATPADLKLGDEFHTGGVKATDHLMAQLEISADMHVLDVGSGIGGTSRYIADHYGAQVTGIDLTPEFVDTATRLSDLVGLSDKVTFHVGSALQMPVPDSDFDLAVMFHVGMNIADKGALIAEVARTLKPGGNFAVFDVMAGTSDDPLVFPLPWSTAAKTSFLAPPEAYIAAAEQAGLTVIAQTDRTAFAKEFFAAALSKPPPAVGIHLMMGETAPEKLGNYVTNLHAESLRPVELILKKPA